MKTIIDIFDWLCYMYRSVTQTESERMIPFQVYDGGRAAAGYRGSTGDCVARAVAIASGRPYSDVYEELAAINACMPQTKRRRRGKVGSHTAAHGIYTKSKLFKDYMLAQGFVWTPTMHIGSGCTVHLCHDELPSGRLVVMLSKHCVAVVDRVLYDTYQCDREGTRCVYGYWKLD
jgi:hypothetical protein